jgi:zinc transport system substrate-binding protein
MMPINKAVFYAVSVFVATVLQGLASPVAGAPMTVFVSIEPQKYIVQHIGRELVDVQVMVPPGASPHTYEPKPAQMAALAETRLFLSIGVAFEDAWLPRFAAINDGMTIAASDQGIQKLPITDHGNHHDASHAHPSMHDPHIWLSPPLIKGMADNTLEALITADPAHADHFKRHHASLLRELDTLDRQIRELLADAAGTRFMVFHPSWGYFAKTYGLIQVPIEVGGKEPKPAQLQHLIREARAAGIKVIFAQPQFSDRSAQVIAQAIDGHVIVADPLSFDLKDNLLRQAEAIKQAAR